MKTRLSVHRMSHTDHSSKKYVSQKPLGGGTFGSVVVMNDLAGNEYAGKLLDSDEDDGTMTVATLIEASILSMVKRARTTVGIICLHEIAELNNKICLVLPRLPHTLTTALPIISQQDKLEISCGLADALAWLHSQGIMHRDVKSDNILLDSSLRPLLIDFSLARVIPNALAEDKENTQTSNNRRLTLDVGTPTYIAPEIQRETGDYCELIDAWSLGIVMLEICLGRPLQKNEPMAKIKERFANKKALMVILNALLQEDPRKRMSCLEAAAALRGLPRAPPQPGRRKDFLRDLMITAEGVESRIERRAFNAAIYLFTKLHMTNPTTLKAALVYHERSGARLDYCLALAQKIYEPTPLDLNDMEDSLAKETVPFVLDRFRDAEVELCRSLQWCLLVAEADSDSLLLTRRKRKRHSRGRRKSINGPQFTDSDSN